MTTYKTFGKWWQHIGKNLSWIASKSIPRAAWDYVVAQNSILRNIANTKLLSQLIDIRHHLEFGGPASIKCAINSIDIINI